MQEGESDDEASTSSMPQARLQRKSIDISKTFSVGERLLDLEHPPDVEPPCSSSPPDPGPPGKRAPDDFELLSVVGKGAFGKVRSWV